MKYYFLMIVSCAGLFLHGCGESPADSRCMVEFPALPQAWQALLGNPLWRVEWLNDAGHKQSMEVGGSGGVEISLPVSWASAVYAWPFWPDAGLGPGVFRPAGAIFPFDVSAGAGGKSLVLSWQGGVDATLFWELARAYGAEQNVSTAVPRLPHHFNWPRFRQLFDDPALNAEIRADPWLADWCGIAERIVQSGFDRRRLIPEARSGREIPVGPGPWIGTSPFAAPLLFDAVPVFPVRPATDSWFSAEGVLRCNTEAWIFISFGENGY
ncbi:MAG: hypothetical protein FWD36_04700 [Treponema sp.]|nr:hypothetical protein [Treponema sp.]